VAKTGSGDVYAGRDGNVYRNTGDGWQKSDGGGGWSDVQPPTDAQRQQAQDRAAQAGSQTRDRAAQNGGGTSTYGQLDRDAQARSEGAQRTTDRSTVNRGGSGTGSYRPSGSGGYRSGGASRAGGGGRRR
jgi:hypothetical protein